MELIETNFYFFIFLFLDLKKNLTIFSDRSRKVGNKEAHSFLFFSKIGGARCFRVYNTHRVFTIHSLEIRVFCISQNGLVFRCILEMSIIAESLGTIGEYLRVVESPKLFLRASPAVTLFCDTPRR